MAGFGEHAKGVTHNLIANLIVAGGAGVISWYTAHAAFVAGIPRYIAILIGIGAFAVLAFAFAAVSLGVSKWRGRDKKHDQDTALAESKPLENYERQIINLESEVRRLGERDETWGVQVAARDGQIEQMKEEIHELSWLREIGLWQGTCTERYISTKCWISDHSLIEEPLFIDFGISFESSAVYNLTVTGLSGSIRIGSRRLGAALPNNYPPRIETNEGQDLSIGDRGHIMVTQPLTRADAVFILNRGADFMFDGLFIEWQANPRIERAIKLSPSDVVSNKELRDKYPKLDIKFKRAVYSYIPMPDRRGSDFPDTVSFDITLDVTLENLRNTKIEIDSVQVSLVNISQPTFRLQPDAGEIYERRFIDGNGGYRTTGDKLKNLASFPLSIIGRGKVSGCFQFTLENVQIGAVKAKDTSASLVFTDKHEEHHVGNHDLDHF